MDKQKQIEENGKELYNDLSSIMNEEYEKRMLITPSYCANKMLEKGYRKIPENAVVLTEEEYELFDSVKKGFPNDTSWLAEKFSEIGQTASIRTAEKFARMAKEIAKDRYELQGWIELATGTFNMFVDEICKKITEG